MHDYDGYADGDEISTARLAVLHDSGKMCCECGAEFVKAHGQKTACTHCWAKLPLDEREHVLRATHEETNRAGHKALARQRRKERG